MKNYQHSGDDRRDGYRAAEKYGGASFKRKSFGDRDGGSRGSFGGGKSFGGGRPAGRSFGEGRDGGSRGGFGGGKSFGDRGGKSFDGGSRGFGGDRPAATMHKATCDECKKECEVPFRPSGDKPIFCKNCFDSKREGGDRQPYIRDGGRDTNSNNTNDGVNNSSSVSAAQSTEVISSLKVQLTDINFKLDKLTRMMEEMQEKSSSKAEANTISSDDTIDTPDEVEVVKEKKTKKVASKKIVKKAK